MNDMTQERICSIIRRAILECLEGEANLPEIDRPSPLELFHSEAAIRIKQEIVRNARKLWTRAYVDGNGGNISARLTSEYILCTPTLLSKGDVEIDDLVMVDLENNLVCGKNRQTSEIMLHMEVYKAVPEAGAVIHCHPPYATAHAVAGVIPQGNLVPEQEVFVGPVALTPYETPGTKEFARTICPVVRQHNSILLANHGVVCWADTITHAEWYVEVLDTYCKTVLIASQLKSPLKQIPQEKIEELLNLKSRLGLPDARFGDNGAGLSQDGPMNRANFLRAERKKSPRRCEEIDLLVSSIATKIMGIQEKCD